MKVFILEYHIDYEGDGIIAVFESQQKAELERAKIEQKCERWLKKQAKANYELDLKTPDHLHENLTIREYEVQQ